jgi:hypothetical protein
MEGFAAAMVWAWSRVSRHCATFNPTVVFWMIFVDAAFEVRLDRVKAMGFAFSRKGARENRLSGFSADNSYQRR